jgi:hypothetical protein
MVGSNSMPRPFAFKSIVTSSNLDVEAKISREILKTQLTLKWIIASYFSLDISIW